MLRLIAAVSSLCLLVGATAATACTIGPECPSMFPRVAGASVAAKAVELSPAADAAVTLHPMKSIQLVAKPGRPATSAQFGGFVAVRIKKSGTLRVRSSNSTYVDLIGNRGVVASIGHRRLAQPESSLDKEAVFPVVLGRYLLQLTGSDWPEVAITLGQL